MEQTKSRLPDGSGEKWPEDFALYLEVEKDDSPLTIENYLADIRHFKEFMAQRTDRKSSCRERV